MAESRGSQLLRVVTSGVGLDAVARAVGVATRDVARWESGIETPRPELQDALAGCYNVPGWAWFSPPEFAAMVPAAAESPRSSESAAAVVAFDPAAESLDLLNAQLERLTHDIAALRDNPMGGVNYTELMRLERVFTTVVEKRAVVAGQLRAVEENRLARTETFKAHSRRIVEALRPFPEARVAVIRAMGFEVE